MIADDLDPPGPGARRPACRIRNGVAAGNGVATEPHAVTEPNETDDLMCRRDPLPPEARNVVAFEMRLRSSRDTRYGRWLSAPRSQCPRRLDEHPAERRRPGFRDRQTLLPLRAGALARHQSQVRLDLVGVREAPTSSIAAT